MLKRILLLTILLLVSQMCAIAQTELTAYIEPIHKIGNSIIFKTSKGEYVEFAASSPLPTYVQSTVSVLANASDVQPPYTPNTQNPSRLSYNTTFHALWGYNGSIWQRIGGVTYLAGSGISITGNVISADDVSPTNECNTNLNVASGNLRITDGCGVLQLPVTQVAPVQSVNQGFGTTIINNGGGSYTISVDTNSVATQYDLSQVVTAQNGLTESPDNTVELGGSLLHNTEINANGEAYAVIDTSVGGLSGCLTKRVVGGINQPSVAGLYDNTLNSYEAAGEVYVSEVGNDACSQVVRDEFLTNGAGVKSENRLILGEIQQSVVDVPNGTVNVVAITGNSTKVFSAAPSGTTEIVANGGAGKMQASDSLYLEGGKKVYVVAPDKLYVQPINTGSAIVGDVLTMVGANGETEWRPAGGDICEQLSALPSGTPSGTEKILYYNTVTIPSGWVGYDFDIPTNFPPCTDATNLYLHLVNLNGVQYYYPPATTNPTTPVVATNTTAIQAFLNTSLVAAGFAANDLIWVVNGDNTVTVWANPTYVPNNSEFWCGTSDPDDYTNKLFPTLPTTHTAPTSNCFLGDVPESQAAWLLKGNAGTDGGVTDFVGTTDAVDLQLRVSNTPIAKFGTNQNISLHNGSAASGYMSLATGDVAEAIGDYSIAFGQGIAVGDYSFAHCNSTSNGLNSFATNVSNSSGEGSFAANASNSNGNNSFSVNSSIANGDASASFNQSIVDGESGFSSGYQVRSRSFAEAAFGIFNVDYTAISTTAWNATDRLVSIGNGASGGSVNNALTIWKDGRAMMNTGALNTSPIQNTWFGINGTLAQNFNHIRTDNTFAGFSAEHTPSGKYVILGATAGNVGTVIPNNAQFAFTTTAGIFSTILAPTTTMGNYGPTGWGIGGGFAATSTLELQGSFASNALVIAANYTATGTDNTLVCNNGATAITVTLPDPTTCLGREYTVLRYAGSTGTITVTDARGGTASIQALAGTLGVTTTITALGSHDDWSVKFKAVTVGGTSSWLRVD